MKTESRMQNLKLRIKKWLCNYHAVASRVPLSPRLPHRNRARTSRNIIKITFVLFVTLVSRLPANAQQLIQFMQAANSPVISLTLTKPALQVYPTFYPPESYPFTLQPGSNAWVLNPGTWTANFGSSATYTFNVPTNNIWPAANSTNNWLSLNPTNGPSAFATFGLTTNIGVVWTNGTTLKTNLFCYTNGVLCAIQ